MTGRLFGSDPFSSGFGFGGDPFFTRGSNSNSSRSNRSSSDDIFGSLFGSPFYQPSRPRPRPQRRTQNYHQRSGSGEQQPRVDAGAGRRTRYHNDHDHEEDPAYVGSHAPTQRKSVRRPLPPPPRRPAVVSAQRPPVPVPVPSQRRRPASMPSQRRPLPTTENVSSQNSHDDDNPENSSSATSSAQRNSTKPVPSSATSAEQSSNSRQHQDASSSSEKEQQTTGEAPQLEPDRLQPDPNKLIEEKFLSNTADFESRLTSLKSRVEELEKRPESEGITRKEFLEVSESIMEIEVSLDMLELPKVTSASVGMISTPGSPKPELVSDPRLRKRRKALIDLAENLQTSLRTLKSSQLPESESL